LQEGNTRVLPANQRPTVPCALQGGIRRLLLLVRSLSPVSDQHFMLFSNSFHRSSQISSWKTKRQLPVFCESMDVFADLSVKGI